MGNLTDSNGSPVVSFSDFRVINNSEVQVIDPVVCQPHPDVLNSDRLKDLRGLGRAIYAQLSSDPIIKEAICEAIFPLASPQVGQFYPCIVYACSAMVPDYTMDGPSGLVTQTVTVTALAKDYGTMDELAGAVFNCLDFGDGDWGGIIVQGCFYRGETEQIEALQAVGVESDVYERSMVFEVFYNQPSLVQ